MKKKIICVLLVCFMFSSSSLSCYAYDKNEKIIDGGVISVPILATLVTIAVGGGIIITSKDDIVDLGRLFYNEYRSNWEVVEEVFSKGAILSANGVLKVSKEALDLCLNFFDNVFTNNKGGFVSYVGDVAAYPNRSLARVGDKFYNFEITSVKPLIVKNLKNNVVENFSNLFNPSYYSIEYNFSDDKVRIYTYFTATSSYNGYTDRFVVDTTWADNYSIPYGGTYNKEKVNEKVENDKLAIPIPGNLDSLVGTGVDVYNPTYDLTTDGTVTVPNVSNPSISVDTSTTYPLEGTGEGTEGGTNEGTGGITFPSFGDSLDFSLFELTGVTEKFPFSLPWDLRKLIKGLDVEKKPPVFEVPLVTEKIKVDLTYFDDWANITRWFITISFSLGLIFISTKMKG